MIDTSSTKRMPKHAPYYAFLLIGPTLVAAQSGPPVRALGPTVAVSATTFSAVSQLVALSNGHVLVADGARRIVTLLDDSLRDPRIILDSTAGRQNTFATGVGSGASASGGRGGSGRGGPVSTAGTYLLRFRGDSSLWFDRSVGAFIVVAPDGGLGRVMAAPLGASAQGIAAAFGAPMFSTPRGLVYRGAPAAPPLVPRPEDAADSVSTTDDSLLIVRMNYTTRALDTVGAVATGYMTTRTTRSSTTAQTAVTPLFPFYDNVAVTSDGSIGLFHAREYRFDWITPDGTRQVGARLPYPWQRITDALRQHIVYSINGGRQHIYDSLLAKRRADSARTGSVPMVSSILITATGDIPQQVPAPLPPLPKLVPPDAIPDYYPPTAALAVLADGDNHVWIRPKLPAPDPGFVVWDIVDRNDGLIDRVRVPATRTIAGFGPGGFVYLVSRDGGVATLEKVRIK